MEYKYKKPAFNQILQISFKQQTNYSQYNFLIGKDVRVTDNPKCFLVGIIAGLCFTQLIILLFPNILSFHQYHKNHDEASNYLKYGQDRLAVRANLDFETHAHDNETKIIADQLFNEVRVLCLVMTNPKNNETEPQHVKKTWGPRCNKLIFMSLTEDTKLGTLALPVLEGPKYLWNEAREALKYVYNHHLDEYDWFLKADDETYVIVENLRKMLYAYNSEHPIYFGTLFKSQIKWVFTKSSPGYVLSKTALKRFIEKGLTDATKCADNGVEYFQLARCMENLEVLAGDSRDEFERERMFPFLPALSLVPEPLEGWYWSLFYYKSDQGLDCCSDHAISFHSVSKIDMYELDYLIYRLRPFGITPAPDILPVKKSLKNTVN